MFPKECKRLAEVDFPIAEGLEARGAGEVVRHGHPSTLRLWWARRPLLMALMLSVDALKQSTEVRVEPPLYRKRNDSQGEGANGMG